MEKQQTKETQRVPRNNDPLAHVYLLLDTDDKDLALWRMHQEFVTDMGERLEHQPFMSRYSFTVENDEIVYETGLLYIASLRKSTEAAIFDVLHGNFTNYHANRQQAFLAQGKEVLEWAQNPKAQNHLLVFSLCPPDEELPYSEAKRQSFKPDRIMASVQLYSKNSDSTGETIAFSLDGLTLERLQLLYKRLGVKDFVAPSTIEQLVMPVVMTNDVSAHDTVTKIIVAYDDICQEQTGVYHSQGVNIEQNIVEANSFVASHPEIYTLYSSIIQAVAASLNKTVTNTLACTVQEQLAAYYHGVIQPDFLTLREGEYLDEQRASALINYLRKQAVPEYLTQQLLRVQRPSIKVDDTYGIGMAGAVASYLGRQYDGACPSSTIDKTTASALTQAEQYGIKRIQFFEAPKPIISKGDFDVLPIGSCPVCRAECGTGIKNKKNGKWYCTQQSCHAFKQDIYDYVFGKTQINIYVEKSSRSKRDAKDSLHKQQITSDEPINLREPLSQTQEQLWLMQHELYNDNLPETDRVNLITELIRTFQEQQRLLRLALGQTAVKKDT